MSIALGAKKFIKEGPFSSDVTFLEETTGAVARAGTVTGGCGSFFTTTGVVAGVGSCDDDRLLNAWAIEGGFDACLGGAAAWKLGSLLRNPKKPSDEGCEVAATGGEGLLARPEGVGVGTKSPAFACSSKNSAKVRKFFVTACLAWITSLSLATLSFFRSTMGMSEQMANEGERWY